MTFDPSGLRPAIELADRRIRPSVLETRCLENSDARWGHGATVFFKLENEQRTGSFKLRGATNKMHSLTDAERARGIVAASSGNHGAGVAYAAAQFGIRPRVFVHADADPSKLERMRALGADVLVHEGEALDAELHARTVAMRDGSIYISPYNDEAVVCGQGTVGVELLRQLGTLDVLYVSVGGGGLIGGIAAYLTHAAPDIRVVGVLPDRSPVMSESVRAGRILELETFDTLSDATAGGIETGSITFPICQRFVDEWMVVTEDEIAGEMRRFIQTHDFPIEGSAGVALAGFSRRQFHEPGDRVAIVICSGNVSRETMARVMEVPGR